jgi:prevent-host-death family protein
VIPRFAVKRIPATEAKTHFGRIVQEVAETGKPVIIQNRGDDQAVIVSLRDFEKLSSVEQSPAVPERERVRAALRAAGLLSEPTAQEIAQVEAYEAKYSHEDRERILAELRSLHLDPPLSEIILRNRDPELG